jgi:uncharacterized tellurite resistance protein B-like protein
LVVPNKENKKMSNQSPLAIVKEKYGSKDKLVDTVVGLLEAQEDESKEEFTARLKRVANAKLLHLVQVGEAAKAAGGRDKLVAAVAELQGKGKDKDYVASLGGKSLSNLLDMKGSLEAKAKSK